MIVLSDRALATDIDFSASRSGRRVSPQVGVPRYVRDVMDDTVTASPIAGPSTPQASIISSARLSKSFMIRMKSLQGPIIALIIIIGLFLLGKGQLNDYLRNSYN